MVAVVGVLRFSSAIIVADVGFSIICSASTIYTLIQRPLIFAALLGPLALTMLDEVLGLLAFYLC